MKKKNTFYSSRPNGILDAILDIYYFPHRKHMHTHIQHTIFLHWIRLARKCKCGMLNKSFMFKPLKPLAEHENNRFRSINHLIPLRNNCTSVLSFLSLSEFVFCLIFPCFFALPMALFSIDEIKKTLLLIWLVCAHVSLCHPHPPPPITCNLSIKMH